MAGGRRSGSRQARGRGREKKRKEKRFFNGKKDNEGERGAKNLIVDSPKISFSDIFGGIDPFCFIGFYSEERCRELGFFFSFFFWAFELME